jgi:cytochrome c oxidase subunit I
VTTLELPASAPTTPVLGRPRSITGPMSWFTTVDHKRIGILYGVTAFIFFLLGGIEALLLRLQLAQPDGTVLSAEVYNQMFTMHGTTMIFMVVMPLSSAFANYLMPIMLGARDVAFPRLNAFSYWAFVLGGIFMYSSFLLGGAPNGGWFGYAPNTSITFSPGHNIDFWVFGLQILGIASTTGAVNLVVTALNMRAPGMSLLRMPIFVWMSLIAQFLVLFAMPVITIALFLLMFDRQFGANFFNPAAGGDPLLWQHLFWIFGHPEVYILILPAMGVVSEIIPVFARKPLFGYPVMVFSGIAIGFMGWGVWVHHMFSTGLGPVAVSAFSVSTMFIAVPTGVKIFNWVGTLWRGSIKMSTPMLYAMGFIAMFTIGGLSGVTHAVSPHDRQQTDTYYVVAHFHYVLFGGALFGLIGGFYYWWPKVFGYHLSDKLGKWQFWLWFMGFNITFGPMHILGLQGMPRRIDTYPAGYGFDFWNLVATIGAFIIATSVLLFMINVFVSRKNGERAVGDPWDGRTLEWSMTSPPPHYNFGEVPVVHSVDDWWHKKYDEDEEGRPVRRADAPGQPVPDSPEVARSVHLPSPSYFPLVSALGLPVIAYGMIYRAWIVAIIGAVIAIGAIYAWGLEPSAEPGGHHDDDHGPDGHDGGSDDEAPTPDADDQQELVPAGVAPMASGAPESASAQAVSGGTAEVSDDTEAGE